MENMNELNLEELEAVDGGASFNMKDGKLEIVLDDNDSAVEELQKKLSSDIQVGAFNLTIEDPCGHLIHAAQMMDQIERNGLPRKCLVTYTMSGFTTVVVQSVDIYR